LSKLAAVATGSVLVSSGTGTAPAYSASPTLTTSLTTPLLIGGTTASSTLSLRSTSGTGTSDAIQFQVGSNGATTAMYINTSGNVGIGTTILNAYWGSGSVNAKTVIAYSDAGTAIDSASKGLILWNTNTTTSNTTSLVFGTQNTGGTAIAQAAIYSINGTRTASFNTGQLGFAYTNSSGVLTEAMRIDSSGNLLVGTTSSPSGSGNLVVPQVYTGTSATAANVYVDSTGKFFRSTASASASGTLIRAPQILTSGTSYTTPSNCNSIYVEVVGGGGGGGVGSIYGAGGGGGGYAAKYFSVSPSTSYTYGIGAGGSGSSSTTGSSGGNTTFTVSSTTITGSGGSGGAGSSTATSGGTGTNGDLNITGGSGGGCNGNFGGAFSGQGGNSFFGSGASSAAGTSNLSGSNGTGYGSGGGGSYKNGGSPSGGNGTQGIIRIWEYT